MYFEAEFKEALRHLEQRVTFEIQDIKSNLFRCSKPLIKQHKGETYCRHRLILVSTKTEGFLCGLESYEYILSDNQTIVYISKVDTTMTLKKYQGLTACLVQSYICSLPPLSSIFVFARAQPQYLFAKSAENKLKAVLNDRELVSWWLSILNKVPVQSKGWWSVPGIDDAISALIEIGARRRGWKPSDLIQWQYGSSFPNEAEANLVIPQFDDDAKSRLLKSLQENNENEKLTVSDFWNILSIGEECGSGKITGFFELKLLKSKSEKVEKIKEKSDLKNSEFTLFWNKFMSLDFHDNQSNLESTEKAIENIKKIFPTLKSTIVHVKGQISDKTKETGNQINNINVLSVKRKSTTDNTTISDNKSAVNMLSGGLIKRKSTMDNSTISDNKPAVNMLSGGLIKRKKV